MFKFPPLLATARSLTRLSLKLVLSNSVEKQRVSSYPLRSEWETSHFITFTTHFVL